MKRRIVFCLSIGLLFLFFGEKFSYGYSILTTKKWSSLLVTVREKLQAIGMFEEHPLLEMRKIYYRKKGKKEGKLIDSGFLFLRWDFNGRLVKTILPRNKIIFELDEQSQPTIKFIFDPRWLNCAHCQVTEDNISLEIIKAIIKVRSVLELPY